ncbi:MAG: undecaprenyl-diphosphate phosphatase, partial [Patescibacteria group bacterium]
MNIFQSIILGVVEGITEFLPISSTFHLIFASKLLDIPQNDFLKLFEVVIQGGAILSVVILYIKELLSDRELLKKVIVSFLPTATIGFVLYKVIKNVFFEADLLMLAVFLIVGIIFIVVEKSHRNQALTQPIDKLTYKDAFIIGLVQALAVIPGVSRAGSVILAMIFLGYNRPNAAKYSFMLSIPTILAASGY